MLKNFTVTRRKPVIRMFNKPLHHFDNIIKKKDKLMRPLRIDTSDHGLTERTEDTPLESMFLDDFNQSFGTKLAITPN